MKVSPTVLALICGIAGSTTMMLLSNAKLSSTDIPRDPVSKTENTSYHFVHRLTQQVLLELGSSKPTKSDFEIWASDQSNSVSGNSSAGTNGSFIWIWDGKEAIKDDGASMPKTCTPYAAHGPCDLWDVFPAASLQTKSNRSALNESFGRLHGMLKDPQAMYVTANIYTPGGGYVGIIDARTKEAVALFRVTEFNLHRSVHMSFWSSDGSSIIIDNLHGKAIERIEVTRDKDGNITDLQFNRSATVSLGTGGLASVTSDAEVFDGLNAFGHPLLGEVIGDYTDEGLSELTPAGKCKENGCGSGSGDGAAGGRPNNVPICTSPSDNDNVYVTLGGGGLFVLDITSTPMAIEAEYGNAVINGAGCGGGQSKKGTVFLTGGLSGGSAGADQSTFTLYAFDDTKFEGASNQENYPMPVKVFQDAGNTRVFGNNEGPENNSTGQKPGITTRRESHGTTLTMNGKYVHVADRIGNVIEVFDAKTYEHVNTYDLVSMDGKSGRSGPSGPCFTKSVLDDGELPLNDPAPDLMTLTPDGKYLAIGFRGPVPVSVPHSAQGSCPGVGIVELTDGGKSGKLINVLRTTNTVDDFSAYNIPGGHPYAGAERSDIHAAMTIPTENW